MVQRSVWLLKVLLLMIVRTDSWTVEQYTEQMLFANKKHEVQIVNNHKIVVNRGDDKRPVQADGIAKVARENFA